VIQWMDSGNWFNEWIQEIFKSNHDIDSMNGFRKLIQLMDSGNWFNEWIQEIFKSNYNIDSMNGFRKYLNQIIILIQEIDSMNGFRKLIQWMDSGNI
jgi:phosphoribosyl 1,2-cyclic phosphodiesterase